MKKSILSAAIVASLFSLNSCKEEDPKPEVKSNKELLKSGSWIEESNIFHMTIPRIETKNTPPNDCDLDNIITFISDSTVTTDEGLTKCNSDQAQVVTEYYSLSPDQKTIYIWGQTATIVEISSSKFILSAPYSNIDENGDETKGTIVSTLKKL
jgi:hypothetical protein